MFLPETHNYAWFPSALPSYSNNMYLNHILVSYIIIAWGQLATLDDPVGSSQLNSPVSRPDGLLQVGLTPYPCK